MAASTVPAATGTTPAGTTPTGTAPEDVAERLDRLSAQVADMAAMMQAEREERQRWRDLAGELTPVAQGAMGVLERELEDLSTDVTVDDAVRFLRTATRSMPRLEVLIAQLDSLAELMSDVTSLAGANVGRLSETLAVAQQKGYFGMVSAAADVVETAVTSIDEQDLRALRENVVPIFDTVKEVTQPEVMGLVRRAVTGLRDGEAAGGPAAPPSTFALLRQLHDPQVRLGLARALALLRAIGAPPVPPAATPPARPSIPPTTSAATPA